jgi:hypothetical protein
MHLRRKRSSPSLGGRSILQGRLLALAVMLVFSSVATACSSHSSADPKCTESIARDHLKAARESAAIMRDVAARLTSADKPAERQVLSQELSRQVHRVKQLTGAACA